VYATHAGWKISFNVKLLHKTGTQVPVVTFKGRRSGSSGSSKSHSGRRYLPPAQLQYRANLRRSGWCDLRIKDIDLERGTLTVHEKEAIGQIWQ
jgi:hypothetical protein